MKKNLFEYKHIIWDWNGTLLEDVELCKDIINGIIRKHKLPKLSLKKYREIFTFPVVDYYKAAGLPVDNGNFEILGKEFISEYEKRKYECSLFANAEKVLEKISEAEIPQSILSAYSQQTLNEFIDHFGLKKYFIKLVGLDNIYATSKLQNGINWISELGLQKGEALMIGDTLHDCDVANGIGADSLLISSGHQNKQRLSVCGGKIIDSIEELLIM